MFRLRCIKKFLYFVTLFFWYFFYVLQFCRNFHHCVCCHSVLGHLQIQWWPISGPVYTRNWHWHERRITLGNPLHASTHIRQYDGCRCPVAKWTSSQGQPSVFLGSNCKCHMAQYVMFIHCGFVTPYMWVNIEHWLCYWLVAWWHQAIT